METALALNRDCERVGNVINITIIGKEHKTSKRHSNAKAGESQEVYPLTKDEVERLFHVADYHVNNAKNAKELRIAKRNKLLMTIGFNTGLRASDIRTIKWSFFLDDDGNLREFYKIQPQKTKKYKKYVKVFFNDSVKKALKEYRSDYPVEDYDDYIFRSNKGDGPIQVHAIYDIVKSLSKEAGIKKNVGSHSMRKTWGSMAWNNADDKSKALVVLQQCFNHSSSIITARYIGIMDDDINDIFNNVNI